MEPMNTADLMRNGIPVYTERGLVYFKNWRAVEKWYFYGII